MKVCEILQNLWVNNFIFLHKFRKETPLVLNKFTQLEIFLHYHRSWRLQQIFSLLAFTDVYERKEVIGFEPTAPF